MNANSLPSAPQDGAISNVVDLAAARRRLRPIDALALLRSANDAELDALSDSVWEDIRVAAIASGDGVNVARYHCAKARRELPARFRVDTEDPKFEATMRKLWPERAKLDRLTKCEELSAKAWAELEKAGYGRKIESQDALTRCENLEETPEGAQPIAQGTVIEAAHRFRPDANDDPTARAAIVWGALSDWLSTPGPLAPLPAALQRLDNSPEGAA